MRGSLERTRARLQNPEHTGENRCIPCTIVNVLIATVGSVLLARRSRNGALVAFVGSLGAIALRGYLVPGTPTLTKRYFPDRLLARFDKHPLEEREREWEPPRERAESGEAPTETMAELERQRENAVEPEEFLLEIGAVEPCDGGTDLCFTDDLADAIDERAATLPEEPFDRERVAELYDVDPAVVTVEDRPYPAVKIGRQIHKWPSTAAFTADVATHRGLAALTDRWADVPQGQRVELLEVLRSFHDSCPHCGGRIALSEDTVESCCRSYEVLALNCEACSAPLLEFDPQEIGGGSAGGGFVP
jgi:hypothetical protein